MSRTSDFIEKARNHYNQKLAEEKAQFEVSAISDTFVEHNINVIVGLDGFWDDLAAQLQQYVYVQGEDAQALYIIVSKNPIPRPRQLYLLWNLAREIAPPRGVGESDAFETLETLYYYEGPYKLEVPTELLDPREHRGTNPEEQ